MSGFAHDIAGGQGNLIITSVQSPNYAAGSAGWQVKKDGSAEFNNLTIRGTFNGTDFILNGNGFFLYSGVPALGNLSASVVPGVSTVTDPKGNTAEPGITSYNTGNGLIAQLFTGGLQLGKAAQIEFTGGASPGGVSPIVFTSGGGASLNSGGTTALDVVAFCQIVSSLASGVTNGTAQLSGGQVSLGAFSSVNIDDNNNRVSMGQSGSFTGVNPNTFAMPAGYGPFIAGEGFHDISNGVGGVVARVKKLPWNAVWLDVEATEGATGTFTLATLPDSSYSPVRDRRFALGASGGTNARVFVPTSPAAAVQLIVGGTASWSGGASVMYPTN